MYTPRASLDSLGRFRVDGSQPSASGDRWHDPHTERAEYLLNSREAALVRLREHAADPFPYGFLLSESNLGHILEVDLGPTSCAELCRARGLKAVGLPPSYPSVAARNSDDTIQACRAAAKKVWEAGFPALVAGAPEQLAPPQAEEVVIRFDDQSAPIPHRVVWPS